MFHATTKINKKNADASPKNSKKNVSATPKFSTKNDAAATKIRRQTFKIDKKNPRFLAQNSKLFG